ncbi:hypothetical protein [Streptomyces sp. NPDC048489]|uniref:hypothetical protein n=1 Tax=Streptomyces sp. NPDC048489 TaxID=3154504 RepID=UPI003438EB67
MKKLNERMKSRLALAAPDNTVARRDHADRRILHSDPRSQLRSRKFVRAPDHHRMANSIGRVGAAGGNAHVGRVLRGLGVVIGDGTGQVEHDRRTT